MLRERSVQNAVIGVVCGCLLWVALSAAQTPGTAVPWPPPAELKDAPAVDQATTLRTENLALRQQLELVNAQLRVCGGRVAAEDYKLVSQQLEGERLKLIADFEHAHPGWTLDAKTLAVTKKGGS